MIRRPPRSTPLYSSAASDVYKRQIFGGKPKAGKTTFTFGIVYAMLMGLPFMGLETHKARVLYITEQNKTTIRPKLYEYGLLDSPDLHIMFPRQMLRACMGRHYHPGRHLL